MRAVPFMKQNLQNVRIVIRGRVQGVFFRATTQEQGTALNLNGWVRNLASGDVEIQASGERKSLQVLIDWCHQGPDAARVDGVEVEWCEDINPDFRAGFSIR